jgi:hypothetical protein
VELLKAAARQVAKAEKAVAGQVPIKRNRFIQLAGDAHTVNRDLEAKARPASTPSPPPTPCPTTSARPSTASTTDQVRTSLSQVRSSADGKGK